LWTEAHLIEFNKQVVFSINTSGNPTDANAIPIPKHDADRAFDAATCIGCGACVASCKNLSMLFVSAKVSQYALLPQGKIEAADRIEHGSANGCRRIWELY
jgi:succinate dehydrogenase / fumarate reductase iron-sulfur subunit